ncbi:phage head closure protein [Microbaculum marinum]|uniref:Phage head closure protein n=1 Tax=Microbaculum marinum TaxID=1764581 RepID=A0AAW9S0H6_9HYPH
MSAPAAIGRLRHRVRLQAPVDSDDGAGGTTRSWSDVATLWGRIEPVRATERTAAGRIEAAARHRLTIRWRADVTHDMRVVFGTRVFSILGLTDVEARHRFLVCDCEETAQ